MRSLCGARDDFAPLPGSARALRGRAEHPARVQAKAAPQRLSLAAVAVPLDPLAEPASRRKRASAAKQARMAPRRKQKRTLKPRLPARVRTKKRKSKTKNAQHPELIGLGLLALGIFSASVLYLGWSGGMVGGWIVDGFTATIGAAAYVAPIAFLVVGALMVARSAARGREPFRTGLAVDELRPARGARREPRRRGRVAASREVFGLLVGSTGTTIIGVLALVIGALLLSGASAGALVRRSGHAVRRAHDRARRARPAR